MNVQDAHDAQEHAKVRAYSDWRVTPGLGWGPLRFGQTVEEVLAVLDSQGILYRLNAGDENGYVAINCDAPDCMCNFTCSGERWLAQIVIGDSDFTINGSKPIFESLTQSLISLGVREYADTLWSNQVIDADFDPEFENSEPEIMPLQPSAVSLIDFGTLWIKSLGAGLMLSQGNVTSVALRRCEDIPKSHCGPLLESHLQFSLEADLNEQLAAARQTPMRAWNDESSSALAKSVMLLATIGLIATVYLVYSGTKANRERWLAAPALDATVVATQPIGAPFPEIYTLEFQRPGYEPRRVDVSWQYVRHDLKGEKSIEMRYLPGRTVRALTLAQIREMTFMNRLPTVLYMLLAYFPVMLTCGLFCSK